MAGVKQKFIAQTGITFDLHKLRIEAGAEIPSKISQSEIDDLLETGAIKVREDESEDASK